MARDGRCFSAPEMLRELERLALVVRGADLAIKRVGLSRHALEGEPTDDLAILEQEGNLVAADLQHAARARQAAGACAEAGVEKARENVRYDMFLPYLKDDPIPLI